LSDSPHTVQIIAHATAQLTQEQQAVVAHRHGHARVIAVAGAGKTATLTHFVCQRLAEGVSARRILVLMYNKDAQQEFQQRIEGLASTTCPGQALPQVRTFHSLGLKIYQSLVDCGALPAWEGRILSDAEAEGVVWRLLQQAADDDTRQDILSQRRKWVEPAMAFIDRVKAGWLPAADVFEELDYPAACKLFVEVFYQFEEWRRQSRRISYADMIYDPVMCLRAHPELADRFGGHMQWILVDEYQDINDIQQALLHILWGGRGHVVVIGDPDQTIYEFRGSRPEFIVSGFAETFGEVTTYQLPHTFRYGHALSLAANSLIHANPTREAVTGLSHASVRNTRVKLHRANNETALTLTLIQNLLDEDADADVAVIHRLWAQSAALELALLRTDIPYQLDHSRSVLEARELRVFWLLLEIAAGVFQQRSPAKRQDAWLHLLTTPFPKVKRALLEDIARALAHKECDYGEALMAALPQDMSHWQKQQLEVRAQLVSDAECRQPTAWRLFKDYVDLTDLEEGIRDTAFSAQQIDDRLQTVRAFLQYAKSFEGLASDFLTHWRALLKKVKAQKSQVARVTLTSAHKSKGREWHSVIIPGFNRQFYPYVPEGDFTLPADIESERRLVYVSLTRARRQCHLMAPGPSDKPLIDQSDRDRVSVFERELQLERGAALLTAVESKTPWALNGKDGGLAPWWSDYLAYLNASDLTIEWTQPQSKNNRAADGKSIKTPGGIIERKFDEAPRIEHDTLGQGTVLSEDEHYLVVRFDQDQRNRKLDRDTAKDKIRRL